MPNKGDSPDREIARIAAAQHGVITARQLASVGLGRSAISARSRSGRLHRVHRGVYAVGHLGLSDEGRWMAAVLACGAGAVLSHASAALLWGFLRPLDEPIDVSVPSSAGARQRRGTRVHRCAALAAVVVSPLFDDFGQRRHMALVTTRNGIPVTTVQRTIDDLRGAVAPHLERRARRQAELAGWRLEGAESDATRSDLEAEFVALCRRCRIPSPEVNSRIGRITVDFLWPERRLVVETDGFAYHRGSVSFEEDHARDLDLRSQGFTVLRFTGRQLREAPERVAADVRAVLDLC